MSVYQHAFEVHASIGEVSAFHDDPAALIAITPPPMRVMIERFDAPVQTGSRIEFVLRVGPLRVRWAAQIAEYVPLSHFRDVQLHGPFAAWSHTHTFTTGPHGTMVGDRVEYQPPFGWFGKLIDPLVIRAALRFLFRYRARQTKRLLERFAGTQ